MAVKPAMHGRDHRPGASDPIPVHTVKVTRVAADANVSVPDGFTFATEIPWTTVTWDSGGMFSLADPTHLKAPVDGIYLAEGTANYNGGFLGMYGVAIKPVAPTDFWAETQFYSDGTYFVAIQAVGFAKLLAGETLAFVIEQKTGAARNLLNTGSKFGMTCIGPIP